MSILKCLFFIMSLLHFQESMVGIDVVKFYVYFIIFVFFSSCFECCVIVKYVSFFRDAFKKQLKSL